MKRNVYLIILSVITVICIISGIAINVIKPASNFLKDVLGDADSGTYTSNAETKLDAFENIDIDVNVINVTITEGSEFGYTLVERSGFSIGNTLKTQINLSGNTLKVTQSGSSGIISLGSSATYKLTIVVPQGTQLNDITVNSDVGNIAIENANISSGRITSNVGNIIIGSCVFLQLDVSADVGNINISGIADINNCNVDISTDLGNITYLNASYKHSLTKEVSDTAPSLTVSTDVGNVVVSK